MKTDKHKKSKYAFNINEIKIKKKFQGSLKDFQKLNRGLYDEIESNDMSIKENKNKLKKLKHSAVKEFVYTNKEIPDHWKTKLDYESSLLKLMVKDKDFLFYLGHGGGGDNIRLIKEAEKNNTPRLNLLNKSPKEKGTFPKLENINKTSTVSNKIVIKNDRFKETHNIPDKEILGILEEFKSAYPLFEKEKNQENNTKEKNANTDRNSKTFYDSKNLKNNYLTQRKNNSVENKTISSFPSIKQKHSRRQNTFRQNIFTNLIPSTDKNGKTLNKNMTGFNSCTNFRKKKIDFQDKGSKYIFLNSNNDFYKKVNINNPKVIKYLEGINFFGPYFSFCPPCGNRNLEFYKNLEQNQCLQIIQQIKKNKGKNIIVNSNKTKEKNGKKNMEKMKRESIELYENSIKYNSGSINNNYYESDGGSMVQHFSEGTDEREKYDMFN